MADSQHYIKPLLDDVDLAIVQLQINAYARMRFLEFVQERRHVADSEGHRRTDT